MLFSILLLLCFVSIFLPSFFSQSIFRPSPFNFQEYPTPSPPTITSASLEDTTTTTAASTLPPEHRPSFSSCTCEYFTGVPNLNCPCSGTDIALNTALSNGLALSPTSAKSYQKNHFCVSSSQTSDSSSPSSSVAIDIYGWSWGDPLCVVTETNPTLGRFFDEKIVGDSSFTGLDDLLGLVGGDETVERPSSILGDGDLGIVPLMGLVRDGMSGMCRDGNADGNGVGMDDRNGVIVWGRNSKWSCWVGVDSSADLDRLCQTGTVWDSRRLLSWSVTGTNTTFQSDTPIPAISFSNATGEWICGGVLQSLQIRISYAKASETDPVIIQTATIVVGQQSVSVADSRVSIDVSVDWLKAGLNWDDVRTRGGNPGYMIGAPVMAGKVDSVVTDGVLQMRNGFAVPTSGQSCNVIERYSALRFGENLVTACVVSVSSEAEMIQLCNHTADFVSLDVEDVTLIGRFGNADFGNLDEWITIFHDEENDLDSSYEGGTSQVCRNFPSRISFEFVIVKSGPKRSEQWKIRGVRKSIAYRDWMWNAGQAPTTPHTRHVVWDISFVEDIAQLVLPVSPHPKVIFNIPKMWFYPIELLIGGQSSRTACLMSSLLLIVVFVFS